MSGLASASHLRTGGKPSKKGFQYGSSCSLRSMARPIAGTCDVVMAPTIVAMASVPPGGRQPGLERFLGHAGLLCADVLHVEAEDAREFRQVVDVAACLDQLEDVAVANRLALLRAQAVLLAVGVLVAQELGAVGRIVEREAHPVQRITLARLLAIEDGRSRYPAFLGVHPGLLSFPVVRKANPDGRRPGLPRIKSLRLDARRDDDLPPATDLAVQQRAELGGRAGLRSNTHLQQSLQDRRGRQRVADRDV